MIDLDELAGAIPDLDDLTEAEHVRLAYEIVKNHHEPSMLSDDAEAAFGRLLDYRRTTLADQAVWHAWREGLIEMGINADGDISLFPPATRQ